jgi:hypothetical protein
MTTAILHADVQRSRFLGHALAALTRLIPTTLRASNVDTRRQGADSAALEAQRVRELAHTYAKTDPGFAADLYAAAARHEGLRG